jgi:hypothetical protein
VAPEITIACCGVLVDIAFQGLFLIASYGSDVAKSQPEQEINCGNTADVDQQPSRPACLPFRAHGGYRLCVMFQTTSLPARTFAMKLAKLLAALISEM